MTIWNIVLDGITLINLIMCIGFSVDFSAHFCYHYIDLKHRAGEKDKVSSSPKTRIANEPSAKFSQSQRRPLIGPSPG